ncbi:MAG: RNA-binding cell elongation regulator Jag/EloR [Lachnospiraceae bacterium]
MAEEYIEFSEKTLDDAITAACQKFSVTSDRLDYEVIDQGSAGFLGFNARNAVIRARVKEESLGESKADKVQGDVLEEVHAQVTREEAAKAPAPKKKPARRENAPAKAAPAPAPAPKEEEPKVNYTDEQVASFEKKATEFLKSMFGAMNMEVEITTSFDHDENILTVDFEGDDMGVLIGKRGQTLDSIQYLVSLIVNKDVEGYVHVKTDTENYRERRKKTLENLAKNIAFKVKRTRKAVALEPMNPYERRIIHSALQGDRYVTTYSEGEDPYRKVVIAPKR